ncbi:uncharacterized protein METZ01_LOCUS140920 [marine metagenome]|uniref:Uncharacterized protein n=1 Tax=marine metagenome TaxID=408172 RepID=A0A381ZFJ8_9ZZZZ
MAKSFGGTTYCDRRWHLVTASAFDQRRKRSVFDPWCLHRWRKRVDGVAANAAVDEIADMVRRGSGRWRGTCWRYVRRVRTGDWLVCISPTYSRGHCASDSIGGVPRNDQYAFGGGRL